MPEINVLVKQSPQVPREDEPLLELVFDVEDILFPVVHAPL